MLIVHNHLGGIRYTKAFFISLISNTVKNCFGVSAMNPSGPVQLAVDRIPVINKKLGKNKGIKIKVVDGGVYMSFHISVMFGVNASAVVDSIKNKLSYAIEEQTNLRAERIDIFIDGLTKI